MMHRKIREFRIEFQVMLVFVNAVAYTAHASDATFTFQGELTQNGQPADGAYDMRFTLWDASSAGSQIGADNLLLDVPVTGGRFTVELDFGAEAFDNSGRWLEIEVDTFVLSPRQSVTRSPYALQTRGIFVDADLNVGIGTQSPDNLLDLEGASPTLGLTATDPTPGATSHLRFTASAGPPIFHPLGSIDFHDELDQLRALITATKAGPDAAQFNFSVTPGEVAQLSIVTSETRVRDGLVVRRGTDLATAASIGSDGEDSVFQLQGGHFGIGTESPLYPLHVVTDDENVLGAIVGRHEGDGTFRVGVAGYSQHTSGAGVFGTGSDQTSYGVFGECFKDGNGIGVYGWARGATGVNYGVVGISTSPAGYDFMAWGDGMDYGASSSIRWKQNIEPIPQPLDMLHQLRGVYFDWDEDHGGRHDVGMIAEEVGAVLPEIVAYEENGIDAIGMDYSKLTPLLVEAIKELRAEKDAEIAALEARLAATEALLAELTRARNP